MLVKFVIGVICVIVCRLVWKYSTVRKHYYLTKSNVKGAKTQLFLYFHFKVLPNALIVLKMIGVLAVLWMAYQWRDFIVFLTPFGRKAAAIPEFRYCLIICSVCVAIAFFLYIIIWYEAHDLLPSIVVAAILSIGMWYACFGACFIIVRITFWFNVLAAIACLGVSVTLFFVIGIVAALIEE